MSAKGIAARPLTKRVPPVEPVRAGKRATGGIASPSRETPKPQPKNGGMVFDPETFLTQTGVGRTVLSLKKNEAAFAQGDPADAIFHVQKGRLRVTVTSANGKEATLALVGAGEFLGGGLHGLRASCSTRDCYRDDRVGQERSSGLKFNCKKAPSSKARPAQINRW